MFKIQYKDGPRSKWKDVRGRYATEAEALKEAEYISSNGGAVLRVIPA